MGAFAQALRGVLGGRNRTFGLTASGGRQNMSVTLTGVKELDKLLRKLPDRAAMTAIRQASSVAMTPMLRAARSNAKEHSRTYAKAMGKKQKTYKRDGTVVTVVGARYGYRSEDGHDPVYTAHLMEFGTKPHSIGKGSSTRARGKTQVNQHGAQHPGTEPTHILQRAYDQTRAQCEGIFRRELARKLTLAAERLASALGTKKAA